jgi:hypothetical protein
VVGSLPFLDAKNGSFFHSLKVLVAKHGPVTGFFLASKPVVVVADYNTLKGRALVSTSEIFGTKNAFSGEASKI